MRLIVLAILLCSSPLCFAGSGTPLLFEELGFQIQPLEERNDAVVTQPLRMNLPERDGGAPNVNVQMQPFAAPLEDYKTMTESQMQEAGFNIIHSRMDNNGYFVEFTGTLEGHSYHWYAKALKQNNMIYLATATALVEHWPANKAKLIDTVDSLLLR